MRLFLPLLLAALANAADWPAFRGPNGSGIAADDKAPANLTVEKGLAWKAAIPQGNSSPVIVRNRVFLTAADGDNRLVVALDAASGKEAWRKSIPRAHNEFAMVENGHATPSMATDGTNVFALFHDIGLLSFTPDGKERWRTALGQFQSPYGLASSLLFAEGNIFVWTDLQDQSLLRAYDAASGKLKWTAKNQPQSGGGYSSPIIHRPGKGAAQVIVFGAGETVGYQAATGERIWFARGLTAQPAASPIVIGDTLYVVSPKEQPFPWSMVAEFDVKKDGRVPIAQIPLDKPINTAWVRLLTSMEKNFGDGDGVLTKPEFEKGAIAIAEGGGLIALPLTGNGDLTGKMKWRYTKSMPYYASPLLYRGVLYTIKDGGILSSFNPADGTVHKQGRLPEATAEYWASPVAADGRVFFVNVDGKLSTVKAGAQWEPLSLTDLGEKVMATPALADGRLIVRGAKTLFCFR
ncbi:MAG: PQQ-binding-like beta-propeller repeat protein [Acidobacteria bacterium]|nr:PQQ-binding-like beta-propeller repeat protein [Acidobacteriota bacterium]